jgi:hypothetical protein
VGSACYGSSAHEILDSDDHFMENLSKTEGRVEESLEKTAHDQLVAYEEGRSDSHPEADALVHVQLTCGLANYRVDCCSAIAGFSVHVSWA